MPIWIENFVQSIIVELFLKNLIFVTSKFSYQLKAFHWSKYEVLMKTCELLQKFDDITHLGPALYDIFMLTDLEEIAFFAASY